MNEPQRTTALANVTQPHGRQFAKKPTTDRQDLIQKIVGKKAGNCKSPDTTPGGNRRTTASPVTPGQGGILAQSVLAGAQPAQLS